MSIARRYHFYAAHRNMEAGEKCSRIHGHTYKIEMRFEVERLKEGGIGILFSDIDKVVDAILKKYDHHFVIDKDDDLTPVLEAHGEEIKVVPFETSAENFAVYIMKEVKDAGLPIYYILLAETQSGGVIYEEPRENK